MEPQPHLTTTRSVIPPSSYSAGGAAPAGGGPTSTSRPRSLPTVSMVSAAEQTPSTSLALGLAHEESDSTKGGLRRIASNVVKAREENSKSIAAEVSEIGIAGLRAIFKQFDRDGDGALDVRECANALRTFGVVLKDTDLKELMHEVDVSELDGTRSRQRNGNSRSKSGSTWTDSDDDAGGDEASTASVNFDKFVQLLAIWQSAARFRLFEARDDETQAHLEAKRTTRHLLPDSHGMTAWNIAQLVASLAAFCVAVATHMLTLEGLAPYFTATTGVEIVFTVLFAADVAVRFFVVDIGELRQRPALADNGSWIAAQYLRFWFWMDVLSMLPLRFLFVFGGSAHHDTQINRETGTLVDPSSIGCQLTRCHTASEYAFTMLAAKVVLHLRMLKYIGHVRYFDESGLVPLTRAYVAVNFVVGHGLVALSRLLALIHICAIALNSFELGNTSYVRGLYVVLYCFSTVGYGDQRPDTDAQRGYYIFLVVIGSLLNAYFIGAFVTFFQRSDIGSNQSTTLLQVDALLAYFEIPVGLREEVLGFESHVVSTDLLSTYNGTVVELPADIRHNLELAARLRVISRLPYFGDVHRGAKLQLCNSLCRLTCVPEEYVLFFGELGEEMFFLTHGFMDVLTEQNNYLTTLAPGSYFGEMAVLCEEAIQRAATVKSISYCELYVLSKEHFLDVVYKYPRLKVAVETTAAARRIELGQLLMPLSSPSDPVCDHSRSNVAAPRMSIDYVNSVPASPILQRREGSVSNTVATSDDDAPSTGGMSWVLRDATDVPDFTVAASPSPFLDLKAPGMGMACSVRTVFQEQLLKSAAHHVRRRQSSSGGASDALPPQDRNTVNRMSPAPRHGSEGGGDKRKRVPVDKKQSSTTSGGPTLQASHIDGSPLPMDAAAVGRSGRFEMPRREAHPLKSSSIMSKVQRQQSRQERSMRRVPDTSSIFGASQFVPVASPEGSGASDSAWLREVEQNSHEDLAKLLFNIHQEAETTEALLRDLLKSNFLKSNDTEPSIHSHANDRHTVRFSHLKSSGDSSDDSSDNDDFM